MLFYRGRVRGSSFSASLKSPAVPCSRRGASTLEPRFKVPAVAACAGVFIPIDGEQRSPFSLGGLHALLADEVRAQ